MKSCCVIKVDKIDTWMEVCVVSSHFSAVRFNVMKLRPKSPWNLRSICLRRVATSCLITFLLHCTAFVKSLTCFENTLQWGKHTRAKIITVNVPLCRSFVPKNKTDFQEITFTCKIGKLIGIAVRNKENNFTWGLDRNLLHLEDNNNPYRWRFA